MKRCEASSNQKTDRKTEMRQAMQQGVTLLCSRGPGTRGTRRASWTAGDCALSGRESRQSHPKDRQESQRAVRLLLSFSHGSEPAIANLEVRATAAANEQRVPGEHPGQVVQHEGQTPLGSRRTSQTDRQTVIYADTVRRHAAADSLGCGREWPARTARRGRTSRRRAQTPSHRPRRQTRLRSPTSTGHPLWPRSAASACLCLLRNNE